MRFRLGRRLIVSPVAEVEIGDDVLVYLAEETGTAMIRELVKRADRGLALSQFKPERTVQVPVVEVARTEKIRGEAI
ncbi:hypothetical protein G7076_07720 [Sphingomonas sp. HDW15A]|uniref:hypothetical protein n=1 Tax=Sphingomonas sp. HDW15A TaxID=2714942 RepID=UPI00140A359C|nr:hypothetical protein [Sphingomonas sp. HDW15A]QIK96347.1 hypothetical protein G7076_07720 [Sphingomonas sp. HDW15A]